MLAIADAPCVLGVEGTPAKRTEAAARGPCDAMSSSSSSMLSLRSSFVGSRLKGFRMPLLSFLPTAPGSLRMPLLILRSPVGASPGSFVTSRLRTFAPASAETPEASVSLVAFRLRVASCPRRFARFIESAFSPSEPAVDAMSARSLDLVPVSVPARVRLRCVGFLLSSDRASFFSCLGAHVIFSCIWPGRANSLASRTHSLAAIL
mmetsp:Transcript_39396/g.104135  ORF Transcript_39396/g.104135 Transcript_39396/m.104135 type:complete len:206 (+) Transcript_39396:202-819(+)